MLSDYWHTGMAFIQARHQRMTPTSSPKMFETMSSSSADSGIELSVEEGSSHGSLASSEIRNTGNDFPSPAPSSREEESTAGYLMNRVNPGLSVWTGVSLLRVQI